MMTASSQLGMMILFFHIFTPTRWKLGVLRWGREGGEYNVWIIFYDYFISTLVGSQERREGGGRRGTHTQRKKKRRFSQELDAYWRSCAGDYWWGQHQQQHQRNGKRRGKKWPSRATAAASGVAFSLPHPRQAVRHITKESKAKKKRKRQKYIYSPPDIYRWRWRRRWTTTTAMEEEEGDSNVKYI